MADSVVYPIGNNSIHERAPILDDSNSSSNSQYSNISSREVDNGGPTSQWATSTLSALGTAVDEPHHSIDNPITPGTTTTTMDSLPAPITATRTHNVFPNSSTAENPISTPHTPSVPGAYPHTPTDESTTVKGILNAIDNETSQHEREDEDITYMRSVTSNTLSTAKDYAVSAGNTVVSAGQTMAHAVSAAGGIMTSFLPGANHTIENASNRYEMKPEDNTLLQHPSSALRSSTHEQALVRPEGTHVTQGMRDTAALNPNIGISKATSSNTSGDTVNDLEHPMPLTTAQRADSRHLLSADIHVPPKGSAPTPSLDGASEDASTRTLLGSRTMLEPPNLPAHPSGSHLGPSSQSTAEKEKSREYTVHNPDGTQKTSSSASATAQNALGKLEPEALEKHLGIGAPPASGLKMHQEIAENDVTDGKERPPLEQHHRDSTRQVPLAGGQHNWESNDSTTATPGHDGSGRGQQHLQGRGLNDDKGTMLPSAARDAKGVPDAPLADAQARAGKIPHGANHASQASKNNHDVHGNEDMGPFGRVADRAVGKATNVGVRGAGTSHSMDEVKAEQKHQQQQQDNRQGESDDRDLKEKDESSTMHPGIFTSSATANTAGRTHPNTSPPSSHRYTASSSQSRGQKRQPEKITNPTPYKDDKAAQELYAKRNGVGLVGEDNMGATKGSNAASTTTKPGFMTKLKGEMKVLTGKIENKAEKVEEGRRMMGKN